MSNIQGQYLGPSFVQEEPSGVIDGVNTTFTLSQTPAAPFAVITALDGMALEQGGGNDYTIAGSTLTLNSAPVVGQKLTVSYLKA